MEIAGLLLGITGPAQQLVDVAKSIKARCDAIQGNRGAADSLVHVYELMAHQLSNFENLDRNTLDKFSPHHRSNLQAQLESLRTFALQNVLKLRRKLDKLRSPRYAATHAMRNSLRFVELERDAAQIQESIGHINGILALAERIDTVTAACCSSSRPDVFRARNTAPRNPASICIDFESKDATGRPATFEGKLKALLLHSQTAGSLGAIAQGMGGVGKTCALRALAADEDVKNRFPGGVYFMSLGADSTTKQLIDELADSVACSGGKKVAAEMREDSSLSRTIRRAHEWFAGQCCLFIFDDLWCSNDIREDVLVHLSVLMSQCGEESPSRVVYSTREERLSLQGEKVAFKPREALGKEARTMLLNAADAAPGEDEDERCIAGIRGILERCSGLPVALNLCGTSVKRMRTVWAGDKKDVWCDYLRKLESKTLLTRALDSYGPLDAALLVSLEFLDRATAKRELPLRMSHRKMHRALCILRSQDWIPVGVLQKLWDLLDRNRTEEVLMDMAGVGVVYAEYRTFDDGTVMLGLRLHDLVRDFALQEAKKQGEETTWPGALLDAYGHACLGEGEAPFWAIEINSDEDAGYVIRNTCGLLIQAGRFVALEKLLRSARWSVKMLETSNILQLEQDVQLYLDNRPGAPSTAKKQKTGNEETSGVGRETEREGWMKALCKIIRRSLPYCAGESRAAWFQLLARLLAKKDRPKWMKEVMVEADTCAPRPWLKAVVPCLKGGDDALVDTYFTKHSVQYVEFVSNKIVSLRWPFGSSTVFVGKHDVDGESEWIQLKVRSLQIGTEDEGCENLSESSPSSKEKMSCGAISKNGLRVATGWSFGALRIFYANTGDLEWEVVSGNSVEVNCVAVTPDGSRVASGSEDGTVRIWEGESGLQVCYILNAHMEGVQRIALSTNGRRVLSLSLEGSARLWDAENGEDIGSTSNSHSNWHDVFVIGEYGQWVVSEAEDESVRLLDVETGQQVGPAFVGLPSRLLCCAISAGAQRVALGLEDATVRIWDVKTGQQLGPVLTGHSDAVSSVAMSADGRRVVSASIDSTVRVWGVESRQLARPALAAQASKMWGIAVSTDGRRVVSGSDDGTVRMWDAESGEQVAVGVGHTRSVWSVALSADGRCVVSGSSDKTVRVWDGESGEQVGSALTGHEGSVDYVDVCAEGRRVVSGSDDWTVRLWDAEKGQQIGRDFMGQKYGASCLAISADRQSVVCGSDDRTMRVWDVECGLLVATLIGHTHLPDSVAFSGDGRRVLSCSEIGTVRLWDVETETCVRVLEDRGLLKHWGFLCRQLQERPMDTCFELPEYFAHGSNIVFRDDGREKIVATLEEDIQELQVISQHPTLVALAERSLVFLRIVK